MNDPKIAIAVYVENGGWGANYGVPLGALMMEQYINGGLSPESERKAEEFQHKHVSYGLSSEVRPVLVNKNREEKKTATDDSSDSE